MKSAENTFSLRPATLEDLPRILEIEKKGFPSPWTEDHFKAEMDKPYSSVLLMTDDETDQQIAGYIVFWMMFEECQILSVAVDLPFRGLGFAKFMIRRVIADAGRNGAKRVILEVRKSNSAAIRLYQSLGFQLISERKAFYSNGESALQMELRLEDGLSGRA